ncbi:MAG: peptidase carboxypeptidase [Marmoricola sp.]|nr:peptidase carboxypeptidase [Marmoricola sp.]
MARLSGFLVAGALVVPLLTGLGGATAAPPPASASTTVPRALVQTLVIGRTVKNRPIVAYRIGDPTSPVKAVFIATMHGNEAGPARILLNLRDGAPVTGADIWLIPYYNRDGFVRHTRMNAHGVDLNRNFPVHWIRSYGAYNSGPSRASERETRVMMRFLTRIRPRYVVSFHQPLDGVDTSYGKARALALRLSVGLGLPRKVFSCNGSCHGTMTQWFNRTFPGAALTVEYGARLSTRQATVTGPAGLLAAVGASR